MIVQLSDITVRRFMAAMFNNDKSDIDNWDELFIQYIDQSGQADARVLSLMTAIHSLQGRLATISAFIDFQTKFFLEFDQPFEAAFKDVTQFGHRVKWDPTQPELFAIQLKKIETKEKGNVAEFDSLIIELKQIQAGAPVIKDDHDARGNFVRILNALSKHQGYRIDKDATDMEEFCVALKEYYRELNDIANNKTT